MNTSLTELMERAAAGPGVPAIIGGGDGLEVPLARLLDMSRTAARELRRRGVHRGDRVGLVIENGTGFFRALFATMYAGGVAVPLALPQAMGMHSFLSHLGRVTADSGLRHVVVGHRVLRLMRRQPDAAAEVAALIDEDELPGSGAGLAEAADALALIQYTSGSTSAPKGVMLTHRNVIAGLDAIGLASAVTAADVLGLWLPLFHDMGLISALSCLAAGGRVVLWPPADFVRRPAQWLSEFSALGCTSSPGPNFFFDYLTEAVGEVPEDVDLSRWRLALNGAETVSADTIERFCECFGGHGFRRDAMVPVYGLAEATLAVTFPPLGRDPSILWLDRSSLRSGGRAAVSGPGGPGAWPLVGVGRPVPGLRARVAGANGADGVVNEIEITGASVTGGYYGRKDAGLFTADGWLRTGDVGFFRSGELYIAGRSKDAIVIRGVNYFAEDAEAVVRDLPGLYRRHCAAVAGEGAGGECLAVIAETADDDDGARRSLAAVIRSEISMSLGPVDVAVHLVSPRTLPRTSSGKIQRAKARALLLAGLPAQEWREQRRA